MFPSFVNLPYLISAVEGGRARERPKFRKHQVMWLEIIPIAMPVAEPSRPRNALDG
jgi:hypothetical protein